MSCTLMHARWAQHTRFWRATTGVRGTPKGLAALLHQRDKHHRRPGVTCWRWSHVPAQCPEGTSSLTLKIWNSLFPPWGHNKPIKEGLSQDHPNTEVPDLGLSTGESADGTRWESPSISYLFPSVISWWGWLISILFMYLCVCVYIYVPLLTYIFMKFYTLCMY